VGEQPFLYGIGAFFAIRNAVKGFNSSHKPAFRAPYTHEKTLMDLYTQKSQDATQTRREAAGSADQ